MIMVNLNRVNPKGFLGFAALWLVVVCLLLFFLLRIPWMGGWRPETVRD